MQNAESRNSQSASEGALRSVRGKKSAMQFFQNLSGLTAGGAAQLNESLRRGALEARQAGVALVLSDFLDPAGYENGLTALVGRGFQVSAVQILSPDEISPATYGDLRLIKSEFEELMQISIDAGTIKRRAPYERYVDESFVKSITPVRIAL